MCEEAAGSSQSESSALRRGGLKAADQRCVDFLSEVVSLEANQDPLPGYITGVSVSIKEPSALNLKGLLKIKGQSPSEGGGSAEVSAPAAGGEHPPAGVAPRASSVASAAPAVQSRVHVALAGLSKALLAQVASRGRSAHARTSRTRHHGPPTCGGSRAHDSTTQALQDGETAAITWRSGCPSPHFL